jgi:hypothetical protein
MSQFLPIEPVERTSLRGSRKTRHILFQCFAFDVYPDSKVVYEDRRLELFHEDRSDADRNGTRHVVTVQALQFLKKREIRVEDNLMQPLFAERPSSLAEDVGKMRMQDEDESTIHISLQCLK